MVYIAVIHKDPKSDYGVAFPDFPGCVSAGKTIEEAKDMAVDALTLHVKGMIEDGESLPSPMELEDIIRDDEYAGALAYIMIPVPEMSSKPVRINISVPKDALLKIDAGARSLNMSRSRLLVHYALQGIGDQAVKKSTNPLSRSSTGTLHKTSGAHTKKSSAPSRGVKASSSRKAR